MGGFSFAIFPPLHAATQPRHSPRNDRGISRQGKPERRRTEPLQRPLCWGYIWILEASKTPYRATQRAHRAVRPACLAFSGIVFLLKRNSNQFNILRFSRLIRPCFWSGGAFYITNPNRHIPHNPEQTRAAQSTHSIYWSYTKSRPGTDTVPTAQKTQSRQYHNKRLDIIQ